MQGGSRRSSPPPPQPRPQQHEREGGGRLHGEEHRPVALQGQPENGTLRSYSQGLVQTLPVIRLVPFARDNPTAFVDNRDRRPTARQIQIERKSEFLEVVVTLPRRR